MRKSVKMWGVFSEDCEIPLKTASTKEYAEERAREGGYFVRPVTVSWVEKKVGK